MVRETRSGRKKVKILRTYPMKNSRTNLIMNFKVVTLSASTDTKERWKRYMPMVLCPRFRIRGTTRKNRMKETVMERKRDRTKIRNRSTVIFLYLGFKER